MFDTIETVPKPEMRVALVIVSGSPSASLSLAIASMSIVVLRFALTESFTAAGTLFAVTLTVSVALAVPPFPSLSV